MTTKQQLIQRKNELAKEMRLIQSELEKISQLERPYVVYMIRENGQNHMEFENKEEAMKKLNDWTQKATFKQGIVAGVFLYKRNPDGTNTILEEKPVVYREFKVKNFLYRLPISFN